MEDCSCPKPASLTTVSLDSCALKWGVDARWVFQRPGFEFVNGVNGIEEESSWTALPDATDDTKVVVTPYLENVNFPEPGDLEDSENFDGAPIYVDETTQLVTGKLRNLTPEQMAALKTLSCEGELVLYRIDANGKFMAEKTDTGHTGIRVSFSTFGVKNPEKAEGKVNQEKSTIRFHLPSCYRSSTEVVAPEAGFNPLTDIKPS